MAYIWDEAKAAENQRKHGLAFDTVHDIDWSFALMDEDRTPYSEQRFTVIAPLKDQLAVLVFTDDAETVRVISLRLATAHEIRRWKEEFYD